MASSGSGSDSSEVDFEFDDSEEEDGRPSLSVQVPSAAGAGGPEAAGGAAGERRDGAADASFVSGDGVMSGDDEAARLRGGGGIASLFGQDGLDAASELDFVFDPALAKRREFDVVDLDIARACVRSVLTDVADTTTGSWLGAMQLLEMHGYDPQRAKDYYYGSMAGTPTVGDGGGGADDELVIDDGTVNCLVCWDDVAVSDALCLDCGHMACKSCWGDAINEAVEERSLLKATCVNAGCNLAVSESIIERVAGDKVVLQLKDDLLDQLVLAKPGVSRCCNADCPLVLVFPPERFQSIPCFCGSRTCVDCGHEAHEPATCGMRTEYELQKHNAKERGNMSESLWAATHVKPCPRCSIPMEKTRGCMHMACDRRSGGCGYEFCWLCLRDWKLHSGSTGGFFKCTLYVADAKDGKMSQVASDSLLAEVKARKLKQEEEAFGQLLQSMRDLQHAGQLARDSSPTGFRTTLENHLEMAAATMLSDGQRVFEVNAMVEKAMFAAETVARCRDATAWSRVVLHFITDFSSGRAAEQFRERQPYLEGMTDRLHERLEDELAVAISSEAPAKELHALLAGIGEAADTIATWRQELAESVKRNVDNFRVRPVRIDSDDKAGADAALAAELAESTGKVPGECRTCTYVGSATDSHCAICGAAL